MITFPMGSTTKNKLLTAITHHLRNDTNRSNVIENAIGLGACEYLYGIPRDFVRLIDDLYVSTLDEKRSLNWSFRIIENLPINYDLDDLKIPMYKRLLCRASGYIIGADKAYYNIFRLLYQGFCGKQHNILLPVCETSQQQLALDVFRFINNNNIVEACRSMDLLAQSYNVSFERRFQAADIYGLIQDTR